MRRKLDENSVQHSATGRRSTDCLGAGTATRAMGGPYSGTSSLAAFLRVGAVTAGLTYGIVVNGFTGLFGRSSAKK
jgi:hypothetical protein